MNTGLVNECVRTIQGTVLKETARKIYAKAHDLVHANI